ncbi:hypothetical protein FEM48_Zijuj07G0022800 [Ziziphus jujuba var. spinosa]|uniref:Uncharacterized protein n=1 Tax=Ziziphus jujuba var. spinosa TaxID=714518 RepID=A0A978V1V8_ZIZJJ|nr:hypothetical protein FEM48_Zijuj07G0022800 [Ziziphus jujuba var. spinosa]
MNLSSLTSISFSPYSRLSGEFPESFFSLPNLKKVRLLGNLNLKDKFPKSNWSSSISYLDIQSCNFTGLIPTSLGNLKELGLSSNSFTGGNKFEGRFP